ncbi:MAG: GMC family oxidoreductase [Bdellovibrio sp.]|nr:GMC family oxidoreductase [Bdellovibrio sp.]
MSLAKDSKKDFDFIVIGAGISGPFVAHELCKKGASVLMLEAGPHFNRDTYPCKEIDSNSQLYWGGGIELNTDADLGILRPKVVGGGSIVNQALVDRFDKIALDSWKEVSGADFFNQEKLAPWYDAAEAELAIQEIPAKYRNGNALIFKEGFEKNGFNWAPLIRAQKDCRFDDGNDCIECLSGCRIDSKQSTPVTVLKRAFELGLVLESQFEAKTVRWTPEVVTVMGVNRYGEHKSYRAKKIVLGAGAIGNSRLLLNSGFKKSLPALGRNFYSHPQSMLLGLYDRPINAHKGPLQSLKSNDATFRANYFKLENVFAPPVAIAMLVPGLARRHLSVMKRYAHMACVEVAVRDTNPGEISVASSGRARVFKRLNSFDRDTQAKGFKAIHQIFKATGVREIVDGRFSIGLHLMGGLNLGTDPVRSVTSPDFHLHGYKNIYSADSSIFPNAPGINPSLTIMAISKMAAAKIIQQAS